MKTPRSLAALALALFMLLLPGAAALAQDQTCIDNAVIGCFAGCNNPTDYSECVIGCATGANNNPQNCYDQCLDDPICLNKCLGSIATIQACLPAGTHVDVVRGSLVLNRATGLWQQTVRLTNTAPFDTLKTPVLVVDSLATGWTMANPDGQTQWLLPEGRPYKNAGDKLGPGASVTLTLVFSRSGTPAFNYTPVVQVGDAR